MASRNTYFKDEEIEKKVDIKQFGRIIKYIIPYKNMFILVLVLMLIGAVASTVSPLLLKEIINKTVITEDYRQLAFIITGLIVLSAIEIAITYIHQVLMGSAGHNIIARIREEVFYKLQELPFDYFDSKPDGKIVVRVTDYVNDLANFFTNYVVLFVVYIVKIIVVTIFMLMISPQLTLVVLITVVPMMICVFALRKVIRKLFTLQRVKNSNRSAFLVESIMGEKIAKNYNRTQENKSIYERIHNDSVQYWLKIFYRNELNTPIVEIFWNIGTLLLYGTALFLMLHGDTNVNAGVVVAFTSYMSLFSGPITQIAVIIQQLAQVSSNLEQVFDTIDYPVDIRDKKDSIVLQNVKGQVDFDNIDFAYEEGVNILENFNLHVKPGETIALVGPTGAGKTTVINMITRFYDVKKGSVKIDGIDVRDVTMESLRREVGVLMQDPFIFKGTIMDNIRYGRPDATDEECIEASKTIFADKFISRLSDG